MILSDDKAAIEALRMHKMCQRTHLPDNQINIILKVEIKLLP